MSLTEEEIDSIKHIVDEAFGDWLATRSEEDKLIIRLGGARVAIAVEAKVRAEMAPKFEVGALVQIGKLPLRGRITEVVPETYQLENSHYLYRARQLNLVEEPK